ncbi:hypothetical protein M422DRAFT_157917 [Sphaerobolus stellatus SS14]|nr:hypothetical protein M422DRAFT_157917 [Sphaerobolus stellatus SS14]
MSDAPRPTSDRAAELAEALADVRARVAAAVETSIHPTLQPLLVAVSKYKPASDILGAYDAGQRDFGENYVNEVLEKASVLPTDIRWHFIGHLQSNKAKSIAAVPNLHALHTLNTIKLATLLNKARAGNPPLNVLIQVNTSGEDAKSGLPPLSIIETAPGSTTLTSTEDTVISLARHVIASCPNLRLVGLMTIGSFENSVHADEENPDFQALIHTRAALLEILNREFPKGQEQAQDWTWGDDHGGLALSMGMSSDFEAAIKAGSGIVRVGTGIFGARPKKPDVAT